MRSGNQLVRAGASEVFSGAGRVVVLSSHFDDAALAVGGSIADGVRSGRQVEVVTVFADGPPVSVWGARGRRLGFRERMFQVPAPAGPLPLFRSPERLEDLSCVVEIEAVISELPTGPGTLVFAPLGIGNHVDHVTVATAAMCAAAAIAGGDERVVYYEDFNALSECCRRRHPVARCARFGWRAAPGWASPLAGLELEAMSLLMRGPSANELVERRVSGPARWSVAAVALTPELEDMKIDAVHQYRTETAVFGGERAIEAMIRRSHHRRGGELIWHRHPTVARTARIVTARIRLLVVAMFVAVTIGAPLAHAAPRSAGIARVEAVTDRWMRVFVDSPAMGREVQVDMLLPADRAAPHPMVYLLEGGDSLRPGENDWTAQGGAVGFFADKDVTVVLPVGGAGSFYTDWHNDDPVYGRQKWETLLTRELPPLLDREFNGNGANAIIGVSMGAQAALALTERSGQLFRAVAAFSSCYATSDPTGQTTARMIVRSKRGDAEDMWGPPDDPDWAAHDVAVHASGLRGKTVYVAAGSGLPGPHETLDTPNLPDVAINGALLEAATAQCTRALQARLQEAGIAATYDYTPQGTHSWPYWVDQLALSWPTLWGAIAPPR